MQTLQGNYLVYPKQPESPIGDTVAYGFVQPNLSVYGSTNSYPMQAFTIKEQYNTDGFQLATVLFYPLRYFPANGRIDLFTSVRFQLNYENELSYEYNEIRTDDGFATYQWLQTENLPMDLWPIITSISFSDPQHGIIVYLLEGIQGYYPTGIITYQTQDGGNTWIELDALVCSGSVLFADISSYESVYYLTSGNGGVYKLRMMPISGLEENALQINVYPNPAKDRVVIEGIEAAEVNAYNALGQVVKTVRGTNEIDLSGLVGGVYLVRITDKDGKVYTNKIMVQ